MRKSLDPSLSIGFVPTMGALHAGHLSLIQQARANNDVVVASIFVNPTQFGQGEDLDKYPRQLEQDCVLLRQEGVEHLFAPDNDTMYGPNHFTFVEPTNFDTIPEGISRPGHFRGVATIVTKLFHIVQPTRAYFGQKDAAQSVMITRLVQDLNMEVEVVVLPTIRDPDHLAMSSRNAYLNDEERAAAPILYRSMMAAQDFYQLRVFDKLPADNLKETCIAMLMSEPLISEIEYVTIDDRETMQPLTEVGEEGCIISLAVKIGNVRLIDNLVIESRW